jgi:hypothetical protein
MGKRRNLPKIFKGEFMGEKILTQLEALARWAQLRYMAKKRTTEVVEKGRLRFHPQDARSWVLPEYQQRLKKLGAE